MGRIFLKNVIDFDEVAEAIARAFPLCEPRQIKKAIERFFWADERSDFWYYSVEQCSSVIASLQQEFLAENFPVHVAQATGLEVVEAQTWL